MASNTEWVWSDRQETNAQIFRIIGALLAMPLLATAALMVVEHYSFFDALYMSVITLTTVGYHEVQPLGTGGRIIIMVYLVAGLGVFVYGITQLGELTLQGQLRSMLGQRKANAIVKNLKDHFIVCGFGRFGRSLCRSLAEKQMPFVVVDNNASLLQSAEDEGWIALHGDVTDDRVLETAGLNRARGLAAVLSADADNLFVVLSARLASPDLQILARASDEKGRQKMERAGASRVINIHEAGANKMAQLLTNPHLQDFMEVLTSGGSELDMVTIEVSPDFPYCGKMLKDTDLRERGMIVVSIKKASGGLLIPPPPTTMLADGDVMMVVGSASRMSALLEASV